MDQVNVQKTTPRVSVVVPSYNHQKFLPRALKSVLEQSYHNYEIRILDDASSDNSVKVIQAFAENHHDVPVYWSVHPKNQGGVITLNELIQCSQGDYIALINSDDLWMPNKLEQQVAFLDQHPEVGAVFTQAVVVDDHDKELTQTVGFPSDVFMQPNRSRGKWLRRMFYELNCLCHPSILIRKSVYERIGYYDPRLRQLPDFHMWIRVLKHTNIWVIQEPLVHLRIHTSNTSKVTTEVIARNLNEMAFILAEFFDGMPDDVLVDGFQDHFRKRDASTEVELACERAFLCFTPDFVFRSLYAHVGLQRLFHLLKDPVTRETLESSYHFDYEAFFRLNGTKFLDEILLSPSFYFARPPEAKGTPSARTDSVEQVQQELASRPPQITVRYILAVLRLFTAQKISRFPALYKLMANAWHWTRARLNR